MKPTAVLLLIFFSTFAFAETEPWRTAWNTTSGIQQPESAYYEAAENAIYVSNIAGGSRGYISKLNVSGEVVAAKWFEGLNDPKGLRAFNGVLYVSDVNRVVGIDMKTASEVMNVAIPGAEFLNDVAVGPDGAVYVSDTMAGKIYVIRANAASVFVEGPDGHAPNGLLIDGEDLLVATWGSNMKDDWSVEAPGGIFKINLKTKKVSAIASELGNLDGLEKDGDRYVVSDYVGGQVLLVYSGGEVDVLQDGYSGAADIAVIPGKKGATIVVPRMGDDAVTALQATNRKK